MMYDFHFWAKMSRMSTLVTFDFFPSMQFYVYGDSLIFDVIFFVQFSFVIG